RLMIVLAAVLWSTSGAFTKLLTRETALGLHEPAVEPLQIAAWRVLFAGLTLVPLLRRRDLTFRGPMVLTALSFALMNALYISALALGTSANAVLLQYTAPMWMYLASVWLLGEAADGRGAVSVAIGLCGIALIVCGGWQGGQLPVVALGLGSGVAYAG